MKYNKFEFFLLTTGTLIALYEFPNMNQIPQNLPFIITHILKIFSLILLAQRSLGAFPVAILAIIIGYENFTHMLVWQATPILASIMWYKNSTSLTDKIEVRSLTWIQFGLVLLAWALGTYVLSSIPPFNVGDDIFKYQAPSLLVGSFIVGILIALRYSSFWSMWLLIDVLFPMILWLGSEYASSYSTLSGRSGGLYSVLMYFPWLMESSPFQARMWLLKIAIYLYGMLLWKRARKNQDEENNGYINPSTYYEENDKYEDDSIYEDNDDSSRDVE